MKVFDEEENNNLRNEKTYQKISKISMELWKKLSEKAEKKLSKVYWQWTPESEGEISNRVVVLYRPVISRL